MVSSIENMGMSLTELLMVIAVSWVLPMIYVLAKTHLISRNGRGMRLVAELAVAAAIVWSVTVAMGLPRLVAALMTAVLAQSLVYIMLESMFMSITGRPPRPIVAEQLEAGQMADRLFGLAFLVLAVIVATTCVVSLS